MPKKILVISVCLSVSFVIVMLFLSHRKTQQIEEFNADLTTDEIADVVGQAQRFERNEDLPRSKMDDNQENSYVVTKEPTHKATTPHTVEPDATPNAENYLAYEVEDEEYEAQWQEVEELAKKILGKDLQEFAEEYVKDLRVRVDESVARIEPLFEDMALYENQLEPLKQEENWTEYSVAWDQFRQTQGHLYGLYVFLREGPAREHFGNLYLSTDEYAKLKTFAEDWYAGKKKRIIYR